MSSRAASPRALVLAAIVAAHAGALLVLLTETRTRSVRVEPEASTLLVILFQPREHQAPAAPAGPARRPAARLQPPAAAETPMSAPAIQAAPGTAIDWTAEATAAAARQIDADEQRARQARALAPPPSPMFARAPRRAPGIAWNHAATHRFEPLGGLATVVHLNDQCAIVLFVIIPFAGGCTLGKPPVRGDLFEHMHDPDSGPEP